MNDTTFRKEIRAAALAIVEKKFLSKLEQEGAPLDVDEMADMMTDFVVDLFQLVEAQQK